MENLTLWLSGEDALALADELTLYDGRERDLAEQRAAVPEWPVVSREHLASLV
jgi:hypothetical protein